MKKTLKFGRWVKCLFTIITVLMLHSHANAQKILATVSSGPHLIKTTDWSVFNTTIISVEHLDGTNRHFYPAVTRPTNPNAMYVEGIDTHFAQETAVYVYVVKPLIKIVSAANAQVTVNSGPHLIQPMDWSKFAAANILVEELDGRNQHIYTTTSARPTNPNAMHVPGVEMDFEQGTPVRMYNMNDAVSSKDGRLEVTGLQQTNNFSTTVLNIEQPLNDFGGSNLVGASMQYRTNNGNTSWGLGLIAGVVGTPANIHGFPGGLAFYTKPADGQPATTPLERMRIDHNGFIGIGTASPKEELSVNGKIRAKEIKVETINWPDYVFNSSYQLPDLKATEQFIKENKHLPEIPSAAEVEKEGISLGEMNGKLLKKIEELTLYLIELKKENTMIKERLSSIEEKTKH